MGKVKAIFKLSGKVGDYVFYKMNGKQVVRKAAAKKKGPKTAAQENSAHLPSEFGEASTDGKTLRTALAEECSGLKDRQLYYRVAKLMVALKSEDPAPKSERTAAGGMATAAGREIFSSFSFQKKPENFPRLFGAERQNCGISLQLSAAGTSKIAITEVQIHFKTKKFRRQVHPLPVPNASGDLVLSKTFRPKKGFTELLMISGDGFLQGVVVECQSD
ncbi:MAG: hypothetical protein K0M56_08110 [Kaistella sp.]|nr:hypothetical protein [Kaistella sp.]